ncbi:MAG: hypothetical protein MHM6MM_005143 [Cercozoa sp. M6MM]
MSKHPLVVELDGRSTCVNVLLSSKLSVVVRKAVRLLRVEEGRFSITDVATGKQLRNDQSVRAARLGKNARIRLRRRGSASQASQSRSQSSSTLAQNSDERVRVVLKLPEGARVQTTCPAGVTLWQLLEQLDAHDQSLRLTHRFGLPSSRVQQLAPGIELTVQRESALVPELILANHSLGAGKAQLSQIQVGSLPTSGGLAFQVRFQVDPDHIVSDTEVQRTHSMFAQKFAQAMEEEAASEEDRKEQLETDSEEHAQSNELLEPTDEWRNLRVFHVPRGRRFDPRVFEQPTALYDVTAADVRLTRNALRLAQANPELRQRVQEKRKRRRISTEVVVRIRLPQQHMCELRMLAHESVETLHSFLLEQLFKHNDAVRVDLVMAPPRTVLTDASNRERQLSSFSSARLMLSAAFTSVDTGAALTPSAQEVLRPSVLNSVITMPSAVVAEKIHKAKELRSQLDDTAVRTLHAILKNATAPDEKKRTLRDDNPALQRRLWHLLRRARPADASDAEETESIIDMECAVAAILNMAGFQHSAETRAWQLPLNSVDSELLAGLAAALSPT